MDEGTREGHPLAAFTVERVTKDDGRYLLYYSWPDSSARGTDARGAPAADRPATSTEPWTPEAGPATTEHGADV